MLRRAGDSGGELHFDRSGGIQHDLAEAEHADVAVALQAPLAFVALDDHAIGFLQPGYIVEIAPATDVHPGHRVAVAAPPGPPGVVNDGKPFAFDVDDPIAARAGDQH